MLIPTTIVQQSSTVILTRATAEVDVVSTADETTVFSYAVPGGTMGTNKMLRLTLYGDYIFDLGTTHTLTQKIKFGGTTIIEDVDGFGATLSSSRIPWMLNLIVANLGVANSQILGATFVTVGPNQGDPTLGIGSLELGPVTSSSNVAGSSASTAIDTTATQTLEYTAQWTSASSSLSFRMRYGVLELV